ncbi:MAG: NUDIX hydrolase [Myxococcota bacterium]|nr:NUDIX hydrolase [Myxococcota bacterium]
MKPKAETEVTAIEVLEEFTSTARCDEGFLHVRRLRCQNRRADGTQSPAYRVDVVDRPRLDAVAVVLYRKSGEALEVLTRMNLRPAAYFRKDKTPNLPDGQVHLRVEEIVAGVLEPGDQGEAGLRHRAAEEAREEAGYPVTADQVRLLGGPIFMLPGTVSEKIFLAAVDVTGLVPKIPEGDGSPLEEGSDLRWRELSAGLEACRSGEIQDAKTEVAWGRLAARGAGGAWRP